MDFSQWNFGMSLHGEQGGESFHMEIQQAWPCHAGGTK